ncbi:MAG TPA: alpha/beta fold hydrolase, partial [Rhizomicrobium sp.]|nr:alpha/beta fold hydrolase [Rhizomicrobium sp.]
IRMSGLLYVPRNATADAPTPGILAVHGYINSRETQDGFAIALARAGYVVLALDQTGHGYSGGVVAENGYGGPDGLSYLRSLPMVDKNNIGLEGHSMGGWAVLEAAAAEPDAYRAMVLEGSATGVKIGRALASPEGDARFPKNLAVVYSRYDEFALLMWGVSRAWDVAKSPKLMALFGSGGPVATGRLYGTIDKGDARILYAPVTTHPGDHISPEAINDAVQWFGLTLRGAKAPGDSLWIWKEVGTAAAFVGAICVMLGAFALFLSFPALCVLAMPARPSRERRDRAWWIWLAATALIPALSFYPFMLFGALALPPSRFFPQSITNQVMAWALLNGGIAAISLVWRKGSKTGSSGNWPASTAIAILTVGMAYLALALTDYLFKVDFRFWVVALKLLSGRQFLWFLAYLIPFTIAFIASLNGIARLMVKGDSTVTQYVLGLTAFAGGFLLFVIAQYAPLFIRGALLVPQEALNAIISLQFVPLLAVIAVPTVFTWRRTNSVLPGALIAGLFVSWYVVAGTAVQYGS